MPPEPLPWDRNKDRKHERGSSVDGFAGGAASSAGGPRWRDNFHSRTSPRLPPLGYYRQGSGYHDISPDEPDVPRPSDRFWSEEDRRYGSSSRSVGREGRGCFRRSSYWDHSNFSRQQHNETPSLPPPPHPPVTSLRSVAVPITSPVTSKDRHENKHGDGLPTDHSLDSLVNMPQRWSRPCSLSKSNSEDASVPSTEESTPPPSAVSSLSTEEARPRKKPRLGWGEGLAKYEKKKVGESEEGSRKSGHVQKTPCESPTAVSLAGCASPLTSSSIACSSSSGGAKPSLKIANDIMDVGQNIELRCLSSKSSYEHRLNLLLSDLMQKEDNYSGDSGLMTNNAMSKLLLLKNDISKELEKTENDIDQLEVKLKTFSSNESEDLSQNTCCLRDVSSNDHFGVLVGDVIMASTGNWASATPVADTREEYHDVHMGRMDTVSSEIGKEGSICKELIDTDNQRGAESPTIKFLVNEEAVASADGEGHASSVSDANIMGDDHGVLHVGAVVQLIMSSNQDAARKAHQAFNRFMPSGSTKFNYWERNKLSALRANVLSIRKMLRKRKKSTKFKERLAVFHYRAAYLMWKEDLYLLSLWKQRTKSKKRMDGSGHSVQHSSKQKRHSSPRSRFSSPSGISILQPTTETLNFFSKLMQDYHVSIQRKSLRMPACVFLEERRYTLFANDNALVEEPISFEKEKLMINPWTREEKELFMDMLATFGKDFSKISSFLPHKTTADCVEFYYKNHKLKSFKKVKKLVKQQSEYLTTNNCLGTSGKKWKHAANSGSLGMLTDSTVHGNDFSDAKLFYTRHSLSYGYPDLKVSNRSYVSAEKSNPVEVSRYESETLAASVLAGISSIRSSEAVSSGIIGNINPVKKLNFTRADSPLTLEIQQNLHDEDNSSDEACSESATVAWTDDEKSLFIRALSMYGKDFSRISSCMKTRSREQCKVFFSKARKCLGLDTIYQGSGRITSVCGTSEGRSDTEDACGVDMDSGICSTQSCSKTDADFTQSMENPGEFPIITGKSSEQVQAERSRNHYDAAGSIEEEVEMKAGKVPQSCMLAKNSDDGLLRFNESAELLHASDPCSDTDMKKETSNPPSFPAQHLSACLGAHEVKPLNTFISGEDDNVHLRPSWLKEEPEAGQSRISNDELQDRINHLDIDAHSSADTNHPGELLDVCSSPISSNCYREQKYLEAHMPKETVPVVHEPRVSVPIVSMLVKQPSVSHGSSICTFSGSALNLNDSERSASTKTCFDQAAVPSILGEYPFPVLDNKEKKVEPSLVGPVFLERNGETNRIPQAKTVSVSDSLNGFCNFSNFPRTRSEILYPSRNEELLDTPVTSHSQSDCAESKGPEIRNGDVKLFGKILSNPLIHTKSNSFADECSSRLLFPKPRLSTSPRLPEMLKEAGGLVGNGSGNVIHLGMEEVPSRTYGFWDGSRIQTGYSKLPESAILLAKCQGSSFQCSQGILSGYQQPSVHGLHKCSGYGRVSGIHQEGRGGCFGFNLRGGVMENDGGGACNVVSDSVAAIKVHYARAKFRGEKDIRRGDIDHR